jgi:hypothetical protein
MSPSIAGSEIAWVVTMVKRCPSSDAIRIAASQIPITGTVAIERAASMPGSSKQATTIAAAPRRSPAATSVRSPGRHSASS